MGRCLVSGMDSRLGLIIFFHYSISATACAMYLEGSPVSFKPIGYSPNLSDFNVRSHSRLPAMQYPLYKVLGHEINTSSPDDH